jgi:hypothetical protein
MLVQVAVLEEVAVPFPVVILSLAKALPVAARSLTIFESARACRFPALPPAHATLLIKEVFSWKTLTW